jgi:hypothetical protein
MDTFEKLMAIAEGQGEICRLVRRLIGKSELTLLLANAALTDTSVKLSHSKVATILGMTENVARSKIENTIPKEV